MSSISTSSKTLAIKVLPTEAAKIEEALIDLAAALRKKLTGQSYAVTAVAGFVAAVNADAKKVVKYVPAAAPRGRRAGGEVAEKVAKTSISPKLSADAMLAVDEAAIALSKVAKRMLNYQEFGYAAMKWAIDNQAALELLYAPAPVEVEAEVEAEVAEEVPALTE